MRHVVLLSLALSLPFIYLSADEKSIFDQLVIVKTDFEITISDLPLKVYNQGITLRAATESKRHKLSKDNEQVNDFAYRAYHLEFSFEKKYKFPNRYDIIEFYKDNDLIRTITLTAPGKKFSAGKGHLSESNFMAVSLEGIPLIMLDSVDRINFRKAK